MIHTEDLFNDLINKSFRTRIVLSLILSTEGIGDVSIDLPVMQQSENLMAKNSIVLID